MSRKSDTDDQEFPAPLAKRQSLAADAPICVQVGGRQFTTSRETLTGESMFFASLLSGRWDNTLGDGSYFIDADPVLFEHILRYLRRGVFPIFFSHGSGHDYSLYLSLLEEARYFRITRLQDWLEKRRYLEAVKVQHTMETLEESHETWSSSTLSSDTTIDYYPSWGTRKVYVCPRGKFVHRGKPDACGKDCRKAQGDKDDGYEEEPCVRVLAVKNRVIFNQGLCLAREYEVGDAQPAKERKGNQN